jgi:hypothetical protein
MFTVGTQTNDAKGRKQPYRSIACSIQTPQCSWNQMHRGQWEGLQDYKDVEHIWSTN